jgi:colicin import membrane protein
LNGKQTSLKTRLRLAGGTALFPLLMLAGDAIAQSAAPASQADSPAMQGAASGSGATPSAGLAGDQVRPKAPARPPSNAPIDIPKRYPSGTIKDPDRAEAALADITAQQEWADSQYINDQRACYPKFFTTNCLDAARERHQAASVVLRPVEVEANAFLRRYKVQQRDLALAQRRDEDEADRARREQAQKEREAKLANNAADTARKAGQPAAPFDDRVARHEERMRKDREDDAANAGKRAANAAAFEKKRLESEQRQREVATKKVEKDRERAEKAAAAAKSATTQPGSGSKPAAAPIPGAATSAAPAVPANPTSPAVAKP